MRGFLYYLPGRSGAFSAKAVGDVGLAYAFEGACSSGEVLKGPDGGRGLIVSPGDEGVGYHPSRQTWRQVPGADTWVGVSTQDPPGPQDLVRARTLDGHWVTLGDDREWLVPVARGLVEQDDTLAGMQRLPQTIALDDDGNWTAGGVLPRYQRLWDIACQWWDAMQSAIAAKDGEGGRLEITFGETVEAAVTALQANYRIGPVEASMLGILNNASVREILGALVDWPTFVDWCKKKVEAAGSPSSGGPAG